MIHEKKGTVQYTGATSLLAMRNFTVPAPIMKKLEELAMKAPT